MALLRSLFAFTFMSSVWNLLIAMFEAPSLLSIMYRTFSISLSVGALIYRVFTNPWPINPFWSTSPMILREKSLLRNCFVCSLGSLNVKIRSGLLRFNRDVSSIVFSISSLKSFISCAFIGDQIFRHSGTPLKIYILPSYLFWTEWVSWVEI